MCESLRRSVGRHSRTLCALAGVCGMLRSSPRLFVRGAPRGSYLGQRVRVLEEGLCRTLGVVRDRFRVFARVCGLLAGARAVGFLRAALLWGSCTYVVQVFDSTFAASVCGATLASAAR